MTQASKRAMLQVRRFRQGLLRLFLLWILAIGAPWLGSSSQSVHSALAGQPEAFPEPTREQSAAKGSGAAGHEGAIEATKGSGTRDLRMQGPAVDVPREVLDLLDQRKRHLDRREEALRAEMERLENVKSDLEDLLSRYEAAVNAFEEEQRRSQQAKQERDKKAREEQAAEVQAKVGVVAKMYEGMPAEEAAARIEKMPAPMAVQVLRTVKSKTAGAILAQVRPDKAAKLTEQIVNAAAAPAASALSSKTMR